MLWRCDPARVMASLFLRFLDYTQRRTTVGRTPLDEWSALRTDLYLTTHNIHNKHPYPRWDSNPRSQQTLDRAATGNGRFGVYTVIFVGWYSNSYYCLLGGLRALSRTIAYEDRLAFILLSFVVLICIHNLVRFYSLPILTPLCAHTAAAFSATSKNYQRKCSLESRGTDTEITSVEQRRITNTLSKLKEIPRIFPYLNLL